MTTANLKREKKPWSPSEKALLWVIVGVVILATFSVFWSRRNNALPTVAIPTPTMPAQNAFDYFNAAENVMRQNPQADDAANTSPPPGAPGNAPIPYPYTLAQKEAAAQACVPALRLLRHGLTLPYQAPPIRSFTTPFPYFAGFRNMARVCAFVGQVSEQQGNWGEAANARLDAVQEGVLIQHNSGLIGMLVGIACQAIDRKSLWGDIDHLNAAQAEAAARRMERLCAQQVPLADILQQEKWSGQAGLQEALNAPNWRQVLNQNPTSMALSAPQKVRSFFVSRKEVWNGYTDCMDTEIAVARQPYAAHAPAPIPADPLTQQLVVDFGMVRFRYVDNETQNVLLTVALALRAYDAAHGKYPATLNALVPQYLSKILDDPFALSGPLRYKRSGVPYLLYSVGPDGKDDGGVTLTPAPGTKNFNDFDAPDSKGDIVAGLNIT